jgi:integrase/recombinase XerD
LEGKQVKKAKVLNERELKKVLDYIEAFDRHAERNRAMVMLSYCLGLRVKELASIKTHNVLNDKGEINDVILLDAEQTKGNDSRRVFVNKKAKATIKRYLSSNISVIQQQYLFETQKSKRFNTNALTQLLKRLYARVGIVGASSHSMRRTYITRLATSGVSVKVIAELVGHKNIATTQEYIEVSDDLLSNAAELI